MTAEEKNSKLRNIFLLTKVKLRQSQSSSPSSSSIPGIKHNPKVLMFAWLSSAMNPLKMALFLSSQMFYSIITSYVWHLHKTHFYPIPTTSSTFHDQPLLSESSRYPWFIQNVIIVEAILTKSRCVRAVPITLCLLQFAVIPAGLSAWSPDHTSMLCRGLPLNPCSLNLRNPCKSSYTSCCISLPTQLHKVTDQYWITSKATTRYLLAKDTSPFLHVGSSLIITASYLFTFLWMKENISYSLSLINSYLAHLFIYEGIYLPFCLTHLFICEGISFPYSSIYLWGISFSYPSIYLWRHFFLLPIYIFVKAFLSLIHLFIYECISFPSGVDDAETVSPDVIPTQANL